MLELTPNFIKEYEIYLATNAGIHNGSVWVRCTWLKTIGSKARYNKLTKNIAPVPGQSEYQGEVISDRRWNQDGNDTRIHGIRSWLIPETCSCLQVSPPCHSWTFRNWRMTTSWRWTVRSGYCPNGTRQKCRSKWNCWILLCRLSSVTDPVRKTISYSLISTTGLSANLWKRGWKSADNKGYFISVLKLLNGRNLIRQKIRLLTAIFSLHSESLQFDCHKQQYFSMGT